MKFNKKLLCKKVLFLSVVITLFLFNTRLFLPNGMTSDNLSYNSDKSNVKTQGVVEDKYTKEWLKNGNFTNNIDPWTSEKKNDASNDLNASYSNNKASYEILGEERKKEVILNSTINSGTWVQFQKTQPQLEPNGQGSSGPSDIDSTGAHTSHEFRDNDADQTPIIFWKTYVSFNVDMSDYKITSANLKAFISAQVDRNIDVEGDQYSRWSTYGTYPLDQSASYDYTQFFVEVADLDVNTYNTYQIAFTQPPKLGEEATSNYSIAEYIQTKNEQAIIDSLENVLAVDDGHNNFTLIIGIYIHSADNYNGADYDFWNDLRFQNVNLTLTYEKKINPSISLSWNQIGNKLPKNTASVQSAILKFDYTINTPWPSTSPNSEFRIIVNGSQFRETIKLDDVRSFSQEASFDIASLIPLNYNVSIAIQVFIADEFFLNRTVKISIDNASFMITYIKSTIEENTDLNLYLNEVQRNSIEVQYGDKINITVIYKNSTDGSFIPNASVRLRGAGFDNYLENNTKYDQYNITIDSKQLEFGNNYLRIDASKKYYLTYTELFTITVKDRSAFIDKVYLNSIEETQQTLNSGNQLDINITYIDNSTYNFIYGANISLFKGSSNLGSFDGNNNQYYFTLNTSILGLGVNFLTITATKENYTSDSQTLTIIIDAIGTSYKFFLNGTDYTNNPHITIEADRYLNISLEYILQDAPMDFIPGATVTINGSGISNILSDNSHGNYTYLLNTANLNYGINFLTIYATREGYLPQSLTLTIEIVQKQTNVSLYINGIKTSISGNVVELDSLSIGEFYNLTIFYYDLDGSPVGNANVNLTGSGFNNPFNEISGETGNYSIILQSDNMNWGVNYLTIIAEKTNFEPKTITLRLEIIVKSTSLNIYINGVNKTDEIDLGLSVKQEWNTTISINLEYLDEYFNFINYANITIQSSKYSDKFTEIPLNYTYLLNTKDLGVGITYLTIVAEKTNYNPQTIILKVEVSRRETNLKLYIDGRDKTFNRTYSTFWNEQFLITANYSDALKSYLVSKAIIDINGSQISDLFTEGSQGYTFSINSNLLNIGYNYLTISASKENYTSQTIALSIQVRERPTDLQIILNEKDKTLDKYLEVPINSNLNITVRYLDFQQHYYLNNASVEIVGEGIGQNLNKSIKWSQYSIIINTKDLDIGVRFLTISIKQEYYEPLTAVLRIDVMRIRTNIELVGHNESAINKRPGDIFNLKISLNNLDFNTTIKNATVRYTWELGQGTLTDKNNDGVYEASLSNLREGTYIITITAFAGDDYEFERFRITLNVIRPPGETFLFQVLTIVGVAATIGISGYLIAYQRVLKYPKPVRKIRKFKKNLKKKKIPDLELRSREKILKSEYEKNLGSLSKEIDAKTKLKISKQKPE